MNCSRAEHDAIRTRVEYFMLETTGHANWGGMFTGQCTYCSSTLALMCCKLCKEPCPTTDMLPWGKPGDDEVVHARCAIEITLAANRVKFVLAAGRLG